MPLHRGDSGRGGGLTWRLPRCREADLGNNTQKPSAAPRATLAPGTGGRVWPQAKGAHSGSFCAAASSGWPLGPALLGHFQRGQVQLGRPRAPQQPGRACTRSFSLQSRREVDGRVGLPLGPPGSAPGEAAATQFQNIPSARSRSCSAGPAPRPRRPWPLLALGTHWPRLRLP